VSKRPKIARRQRPEQIYRATVERYFGKTYWTSGFGKSMTAMKIDRKVDEGQ